MVSVGRLQFAGFPGWVVWLFIHIGFLTGYRNRFGAVLSWWFAFTRDLRRERTLTTKQVGIVRDVYAGLPASAGPQRLSRDTTEHFHRWHGRPYDAANHAGRR